MKLIELLIKLSSLYAFNLMVFMLIAFVLEISTSAFYLCILLAAFQCAVIVNNDEKSSLKLVRSLRKSMAKRFSDNLIIFPATMIVFFLWFFLFVNGKDFISVLKASFIASISSSAAFMFVSYFIARKNKNTVV